MSNRAITRPLPAAWPSGAPYRLQAVSGDLPTLLHPPSARVAVLAASDVTWARVRGWLADDVTSVCRYVDLLELESAERADVVVIDRACLRVPSTLCRLRCRWLTVTIVVIEAVDEAEAEQMIAAAADDAVSARSSLLPTRLRAAVRRARTANAGARRAIGDIVFHREARRVWCAGEEVALTRTEESLLDCLFSYAPRAASVAEITSFVWGGEATAERRNLVHVYIGYLRAKLQGSSQVAICTIRGEGYAFALKSDFNQWTSNHVTINPTI